MTQTTAPAAPPADGPPPRRVRRRIWPRVLVALGIVLVLLAGAAAAYVWTIDRSVTENITRGVDLPADDPSAPPGQARPTKAPQETGTLNYVLLGSDSRDPDDSGAGRSDTMMVVHLNARRDRAYIVSFPRDLYVEIPGSGKNKINAAYAFGGVPLTVRTLEQLTGTRMDHVALVDFEGFISLTEDLGGVTVDNDDAFSSHGYDYPQGRITVRGEQALWFVRERKQLPRGDLDRAKNQRNVTKAIVTKGLSASMVADPAAFTRFIGNMAKHLTVDNSLSDDEIRSTAFSLRLQGDKIDLLQAPIAGDATIGGQSVLLVDEAKLRELSQALKTDTMGAYLKKYPQG